VFTAYYRHKTLSYDRSVISAEQSLAGDKGLQ